MEKDVKSRVKNKKQFDETLDALQKKEHEKRDISSEIVKKTDYGHATRYHYNQR